MHVRPLSETPAVIAGISCSRLMEKKRSPLLNWQFCAGTGGLHQEGHLDRDTRRASPAADEEPLSLGMCPTKVRTQQGIRRVDSLTIATMLPL